MTPFMDRLLAMPKSERPGSLETVVVEQFKAVLLMADDEEPPVDESFFDLGLTSLGLADVKQRLEDLFDRGIDSTELFNRPTVERFVEYLMDRVLADVFRPMAA